MRRKSWRCPLFIQGLLLHILTKRFTIPLKLRELLTFLADANRIAAHRVILASQRQGYAHWQTHFTVQNYTNSCCKFTGLFELIWVGSDNVWSESGAGVLFLLLVWLDAPLYAVCMQNAFGAGRPTSPSSTGASSQKAKSGHHLNHIRMGG